MEYTLNQLIEQKADVRREIDGLNKQLKELGARQDELDWALIKKMETEGLSRTSNDSFTVSVKEEVMPQVEDWDAVYQLIQSTGDFALVQRRISAGAYREMLKLGEEVPGIKPVAVRKINFRAR